MSNLVTQVTLERASRKKDKSVSITFVTQLEQSSEEFMRIDELLSDSGVLYFKSSGNLTAEEIKELESVELEVEGKTKSQRLRSVLFILWQQTSKDLCSFNDFYSDRMEKLIQQIKDKLTD